jgi:hypothetical protein
MLVLQGFGELEGSDLDRLLPKAVFETRSRSRK